MGHDRHALPKAADNLSNVNEISLERQTEVQIDGREYGGRGQAIRPTSFGKRI